jgi:polyferredoxin
MRQRGTLGWLKHDITNRGVTAWLLAGALLAFYLALYFGGQKIFGWQTPDVFGTMLAGLGAPDWFNKWTLYGALYTVAITGGGIYMFKKYGHNRYQVVRTAVVIAVQISLAFALPILLKIFEQPELYFSYLWPLKIEYLYPSTLGQLPLYFVVYSLLGSMVMVPALSIFFGKRWYCSWVCGCGGLANTFGEPWRHLSNKSNAAWKFEKFAIHGTLGLALFTTAMVAASYLIGGEHPGLREAASTVQSGYGFVVVAILSGIVGVVAYPLGGTRVWCRYFCPMAAMIGLMQKFGRFRITVKDNMCISCGLCSKYCEMGIDVRAYAQKNQDFVRASCVGCGMCAEVCPRGVLRLENKWDRDPQELTMDDLLSESYKHSGSRKAA